MNLRAIKRSRLHRVFALISDNTIFRMMTLLVALFCGSMALAMEASEPEMQTIMRVTYPGTDNILEIPISENVTTNGGWWSITVGDYTFSLYEHPVISFEKRSSGIDSPEATHDGYSLHEDGISVVSTKDNGSFMLYDTDGVRVVSLTLKAGRNDIDLSSLQRGIYAARLNNMTFKIQKK